MKWSGSEFVVVHKNNLFLIPVVLMLAFAGGALYGANAMRQANAAELERCQLATARQCVLVAVPPAGGA